MGKQRPKRALNRGRRSSGPCWCCGTTLSRLKYRKRTERAVEIGHRLEAEGQFPQASCAFDKGRLTWELTPLIERRGKHGVREGEIARPMQWPGRGRRVDEVEAELRQHHRERVRSLKISGRNGEENAFFAFTQGVRLKRYGRKRFGIVHEREDVTDAPRFWVTHARHRESGRVIQTGRYRGASEVFHEFGTQVCGLESAQGRKEEAVPRHFRLSGLVQSLVPRAPTEVSKSERYAFAAGKKTYGQKCRAIGREVLHSLLALSKRYFAQGKSCHEVLELLMPA